MHACKFDCDIDNDNWKKKRVWGVKAIEDVGAPYMGRQAVKGLPGGFSKRNRIAGRNGIDPRRKNRHGCRRHISLEEREMTPSTNTSAR